MISIVYCVADVKQSKAENSDDDVYEKLTGNTAPNGGIMNGNY